MPYLIDNYADDPDCPFDFSGWMVTKGKEVVKRVDSSPDAKPKTLPKYGRAPDKL
jgi:hypothetical protein